jgi:NADPH:quinone reductase-like Zn-dependent oxidoreductase
MGIVDDRGTGLGLEGSGIIKRVGANVHGLRPGDRVIMMCQNCFSTSLITTQKRVFRIPNNLSLECAASMPCVYSTVIHSFIAMAALKKGQTVLIHSACGGVGIAAIQICQMIGAKVSNLPGMRKAFKVNTSRSMSLLVMKRKSNIS